MVQHTHHYEGPFGRKGRHRFTEPRDKPHWQVYAEKQAERIANTGETFQNRLALAGRKSRRFTERYGR